jgi:PIN domain nuclease of toxin-antitoxin system
MSGVLLDTCAVIWFAEGRLPPDVVAAIDGAVSAGEVFYSSISAWEIAMLGRPRREGPRIRFDPDPAAWFERFRAGPGLREARLSSDIALAAALLPGEVHADPADRFLIATARLRGIPLVTADRRIIGYAAQGILDVMTCRPQTDTMT